MNNTSASKKTESFSGFLSLNRYFALIETSKPTLEQAEQAVQCLCKLYGAENEADLLERGDADLIEVYTEIKAKIMKDVCIDLDNDTLDQ